MDDLGDEEPGQHVRQPGHQPARAPDAGGPQEGVGEGPGQVEAHQAQGHDGGRRVEQAQDDQVQRVQHARLAVGEERVAAEDPRLPQRQAPRLEGVGDAGQEGIVEVLGVVLPADRPGGQRPVEQDGARDDEQGVDAQVTPDGA